MGSLFDCMNDIRSRNDHTALVDRIRIDGAAFGRQHVQSVILFGAERTRVDLVQEGAIYRKKYCCS